LQAGWEETVRKPAEIRRYRSFDEDFAQAKDQDYKVPPDYKWIKTGLFDRILSALIYGAALVFSNVYCRLFLHVRFKNTKVLKKASGDGIMLYANHTQLIGDVFNPALACFPKRIYTVVSPANLSIPVIGKILPYLGALPIPDSLAEMKEFNSAIKTRISQKKCVVIYPEAHVWEYCTFIRPFSDTSFKYPVKNSCPVYCMTTTYQKRRWGRKPAVTAYIDGPFYPDESLPQKERASKLHDEVMEQMKKRSENSTYEYIRYEKEEDGAE